MGLTAANLETVVPGSLMFTNVVATRRWTSTFAAMRLVLWIVLASWVLQAARPVNAAELETIPLPSFQVNGQAATAHSQGLEIVGGHFYVTARLESPRPKRAILARSAPGSNRWDVWDITPATKPENSGTLDHPGGFQFEGGRFWIPVSQSVRHGRTAVRVFALDRLKAGEPASSEFDFPVADHIGALAVATNQNMVLGANWDTETVYEWDLKGQLRRTFTAAELKSRNLGIISGPGGHAGVAVQDWKLFGDCLYASGLVDAPAGTAPGKRSRVLVFRHFLELPVACQTLRLPSNEMPVELAQEAMTLRDGLFYFLPENLGSSNRCFRFRPAEQKP